RRGQRAKRRDRRHVRASRTGAGRARFPRSGQPKEADVAFEAPPASVPSAAASAPSDEIEGMYAHLEQALVALDFLDPANPKKLMSRLRRLFSRTGLEHEEVNILRGIAKHILLRVKR
ncbi:hypothetical protein ACRXB1_23265, partial [Caballeronia sp. M23-90]